MIKWIFKIALSVVTILALLAIILNQILAIDDYKDCVIDSPDFEKCQQADVVVVISGGDTAARTKHGVKLLQADIGQFAIIFSGDTRDKDSISNAEQMEQIALEMGVEPNKILLEKESKDTHQNAKEVAKIIEQQELESIILVTSGYHQKRAYQEFRAQLDDKIKIYNAPVAKDKDWSKTWFLSKRGWELALQEAVALTMVGTKSD